MLLAFVQASNVLLQLVRRRQLALLASGGCQYQTHLWCIPCKPRVMKLLLATVTTACEKRTGATVCESLRRDRPGGLTSLAFHACGSASPVRARTYSRLCLEKLRRISSPSCKHHNSTSKSEGVCWFWLLWQQHAQKRLSQPQAWSAGDVSPPRQSRWSCLRAAAPGLFANTYGRNLSFRPMAQYIMHALKGLACGTRGAKAT